MKHSNNKTLLILGGATATGKTAAAIEIAQHFNTEIISADSRQCYKELNIGVARPSETELSRVPHHFIASHSIHEEVNAASFEAYALNSCGKIFESNNVAVMVGGTGLYIRAFCEGLDPIPAIPASIRQKYISVFEDEGTDSLRTLIKQLDPEFYSNGEIDNPQRLMRALEVKEHTGQSILSFHTKTKAERNFNIIKVSLDLPREELYQRISKRADMMMELGLLDEAKSLVPYRNLNALQTVGYTELFDFLDGKVTLDKAVELIKQHTRNYAKRQITWFKNQGGFLSMHPSDIKEIISSIRDNG